MGNFDVKLELSDNDKKEVMSSPQLTPYPGGGTPRSLSSLSTVNTSTFDLASLGEVCLQLRSRAILVNIIICYKVITYNFFIFFCAGLEQYKC